jgi:hypothetical protein
MSYQTNLDPYQVYFIVDEWKGAVIYQDWPNTKDFTYWPFGGNA